MIGKGLPRLPRRLARWVAGALLAAAACAAAPAGAQTKLVPDYPKPAAAVATPAAPAKADAKPAALPDAAAADVKPAKGEAVNDPNVKPAGCASCGGGGLFSGISPALDAVGCCDCGGPCCVPGRIHCCSGCCPDNCVGRFLCGLYECICCPDPCYEPHWVATANAAFFVDQVRPITQMDIRFSGLFDVPHPDRAEFLTPRSAASNNFNQANPYPACLSRGFGKGPNCIARAADFEQVSLYMEGAVDQVGVFVELPYLHFDPEASPANALVGGTCCSASGFGDMIIGTKSMLMDCELMQIAFQFKTFLPTGNFTKNIGTAHTSLEPALLLALKLGPDTYLQGEAAYWFAVGGDPLYEGNLFHAHLSLNQVLYRILPDVQLIGTLEASEYTFIGGNYTSETVIPVTATTLTALPVSASGSSVMAGPGLRLNICDRVDFGAGAIFAFTGNPLADYQLRAEFRWRF